MARIEQSYTIPLKTGGYVHVLATSQSAALRKARAEQRASGKRRKLIPRARKTRSDRFIPRNWHARVEATVQTRYNRDTGIGL